MTTLALPMQIPRLSRAQVAAVRRKARRLGTTPEEYIKKLIADDLELDRLAGSKSLRTLSAPIREAFNETSEEEIGKLVDDARRRHHRKLSKR
jgi:hypothetical protein